jgi:uncharacterized damage-inducible protein DinB
MNEHQALREQLQGVNSHLGFLAALEGLSPALAGRRVPGAPHTIFQVLHHMIYWQDITIARLRRESPERPRSADLGWQAPPVPEDSSDWEAAVAQFGEGLRALEELVSQPAFDLGGPADSARGTTAREELLMIAGHNSYHLGQIVTLRQMFGSWPPPKGGDTW